MMGMDQCMPPDNWAKTQRNMRTSHLLPCAVPTQANPLEVAKRLRKLQR